MPDICPKAAARMGYEDLVEATSVDGHGYPVEVALVGPAGIFAPQWGVVVHWDCDPNDETQGTSGVQTFEERAEAEAAYEEAVRDARPATGAKP